MKHRLSICFVMLMIIAGAAEAQSSGAAAAQEAPRPSGYGRINFLVPVLADPVMQHNKETYVLYGCAYCHGINLVVVNGEATDLMKSGVVAADIDGKVIGHVLRSGIPQTAKLSPMPQFSDLSNQEIVAISRWIHYARQQGRLKNLTEAKDLPAGDSAEGRAYFEKSCAPCHSSKDMASVVKKYGDADLKTHLLNPAVLSAPQSFKVSQVEDARSASGRQRHGALLENYSSADVANLMAYLKTIK
jgi:mono/diheme cytochrome c family protein